MGRLSALGGRALQWLFWGSLVLVSYLSLAPGGGGDMLFPYQDKLFHALAYLYFYSLGWRCFGGRRPWLGRLFVGLAMYGVAIELLQGLGGERYMELLDLAANVAGLCLGLVEVTLFIRFAGDQAAHSPERPGGVRRLLPRAIAGRNNK